MKEVTKHYFSLKDNSDGTIMSRYFTNCPIEDLKTISGLVQDANINLSCGDEVHKFEKMVTTLGYTLEELHDDNYIEL